LQSDVVTDLLRQARWEMTLWKGIVTDWQKTPSGKPVVLHDCHNGCGSTFAGPTLAALPCDPSDPHQHWYYWVRHHFWDLFSRHFQLLYCYIPRHTVQYLLRARAHRVLIGACNPTSCPIHVSRSVDLTGATMGLVGVFLTWA